MFHSHSDPESRAGGLIAEGGLRFANSPYAGFDLVKLPDRPIEGERKRWLRFFKEGETLDDEALPDWMQTDEMRQAMGTQRQFSEKERQYHAYQARQNFLREQRTIQAELEAARSAAEQERREKERARQAEALALREKEQALGLRRLAILDGEEHAQRLARARARLAGNP